MTANNFKNLVRAFDNEITIIIKLRRPNGRIPIMTMKNGHHKEWYIKENLYNDEEAVRRAIYLIMECLK